MAPPLLPIALLLLLLHAAAVSPAAIAGATSAADFIRRKCASTLYPQICFSSLKPYADEIQQNPLILAAVAANVSLAKIKEASMRAAEIRRGTAGKIAAALRDCVELLRAAAQLTRNSVAEIQKLDPPAAEIQNLDPPAAEIWNLDPPAAEIQKLDPPAEEIRKLDPPAEEIQKLDPPAEEIRKLDPPAAEIRKLDPPAAEIRKLDPPAEEIRKLAPPAAEIRDPPASEIEKLDPPAAEILKLDPPAAEIRKLDPPAAKIRKLDPPAMEIRDLPAAEIRKLDPPAGDGGAKIPWEVSNAQTWMSAALTNEDTCVDGFNDIGAGAGDSPAAKKVCGMVGKVKQYSSNALALVNALADG